VPDEVRAKYISIIDEILADADLSTISAKRVRQGIQAKVEYDITPHKVNGSEAWIWLMTDFVAASYQRSSRRALRCRPSQTELGGETSPFC
jgi:DEK C terminal domain